MAIKITVKAPQWDYFFGFITRNLRLVDVSDLCKPGRKFGVADSLTASEPLRDALRLVVNLMYQREHIDEKFLIQANSLYRPPFTRLWTGKIDYLDLTTPLSHWLGVSVDVDFITFEEETGLNADVLRKALRDAGLFAPFDDEPWHYSLTAEAMERYVKKNR